MCHGLRTGASSDELGARAEAVLREPGLAQDRGADRLEHPGEVAVRLGRLGDEGPGAVLGGQPRDVAVVLDEAGLTRRRTRRAGSRASATRPANRSAGQPVAARRRASGCARSRLDGLPSRDPAGPDLLGQADRVVLAEGVVDEGVDSLGTVRRHGRQPNPGSGLRRAGHSRRDPRQRMCIRLRSATNLGRSARHRSITGQRRGRSLGDHHRSTDQRARAGTGTAGRTPASTPTRRS